MSFGPLEYCRCGTHLVYLSDFTVNVVDNISHNYISNMECASDIVEYRQTVRDNPYDLECLEILGLGFNIVLDSP